MVDEYRESVTNYLKALDIDHQDKILNEIVIRDAYLGLSNAYKATGKFTKAFEFFEKYTSLNDVIFNIDEQRKIFEVQIHYEIEQKEKEKLDSELELKNRELSTTALHVMSKNESTLSRP